MQHKAGTQQHIWARQVIELLNILAMLLFHSTLNQGKHPCVRLLFCFVQNGFLQSDTLSYATIKTTVEKLNMGKLKYLAVHHMDHSFHTATDKYQRRLF